MANTITVTGPTFTQKIGVGLPPIPGLQSLAFFGTGFDANNANRAPGGPAISTLNGTPVYSSNYVSVGLQSAANTALDLAVPITTSVVASGFSFLCAVRNSLTTLAGFLCNQKSGATGTFMQFCVQGSSRQFQLYSGGLKASITCVQPLSNWHLVGGSYAGGTTNGVLTLYELTENLTPATYTFPTMTGSATLTWHVGASSTENFCAFAGDVAFEEVANAPMNQTDMQALAASVRSFLARRGITV